MAVAAACGDGGKGGGGGGGTKPPPPGGAPDAGKPAASLPAEKPRVGPTAVPPTPLGLPELTVPDDNPLANDKVARGRELFFAARCTSCHEPDKGWSGARPHAPSLVNVGYHMRFGVDGKWGTLEEAVAAEHRARAGTDAPPDDVKAVASFLRVLRSGDSPWDRYEQNPAGGPPSIQVAAGSKIFNSRGQCTICHTPPLYTDLQVRDGLRTPTLRGVVRTGPWLKGGREPNLETAVRVHAEQTGTKLTEGDVQTLTAFLRALDGTAK